MKRLAKPWASYGSGWTNGQLVEGLDEETKGAFCCALVC